jgi:plasmid maintenance system antidote protein VapI
MPQQQGTTAQKTRHCNLCQDFLQDLRTRLRTKLELCSYTQASGEMGVHRNTITKFLNGGEDITVGTLMRIKVWVEGV